MTDSTTKQRIIALLADKEKSAKERVAELKSMYVTARAIQRAESESGMIDADGQDDDLREIELALHKLGVDPDAPEKSGAATL